MHISHFNYQIPNRSLIPIICSSLGFIVFAKQILLEKKMTPPIESTATQTIATIAFGVTATLISVFTVCQGRNAWRRVYGRDNERNAESDIDSRDYILHDSSAKTVPNPR